MRLKALSPVSRKQIEAVDWLQRQCVEVYLQVASSLKPGVTEKEIAEMITARLGKRGVTDYWYDVPVMVLFGPERFQTQGKKDYAVKSPSSQIRLEENMVLFVDMHPRHADGWWGDFDATGIFRGASETEQVDFLHTMQKIQEQAIKFMRPQMSFADLARWLDDRFAQEAISLLDARSNYGHNMGKGAKQNFPRQFIDRNYKTLLEGQILAIEPRGTRKRKTGEGLLVASFEDCVYVGQEGTKILGKHAPLPVVFE